MKGSDRLIRVQYSYDNDPVGCNTLAYVVHSEPGFKEIRRAHADLYKKIMGKKLES